MLLRARAKTTKPGTNFQSTCQPAKPETHLKLPAGARGRGLPNSDPLLKETFREKDEEDLSSSESFVSPSGVSTDMAPPTDGLTKLTKLTKLFFPT